MGDHRAIFVPDASVLVKWALNEPEEKMQALQLRRDFFANTVDLIVPPHCFSELANVLSIKAPQVALIQLSSFITMNIIESHFSLELASIALQLTKKYKGISFYDASYHALAIKEGGTFITAD